MKIAIVHEDLSKKGGAENLIIWYTSEMVKREYDVTIFTSKYDRNNWQGEYIDHLKVEIDDCFSFTKNPFFYEYYGRRALRVLKGFDIVIVHIWLNASLSVAFRRNHAQLWLWFCEEPPRFIYFNEIEQHLIRHYHNHVYYEPYAGINVIKHHATKKLLSFLKILDRLFVTRTFQGIITNSKFTSSNVQKIYGRKARSAHLGIGSHYVTRAFSDMKVKHGCDFMFFFSGRLDALKNVARLVRAFARVHSTVNWKLIIAGDGLLKSYLKQKIQQLRLDGRIVLVGFVSDEDLVSYFNSADIITYIPINEPFGLVPIEALACGKPSIVSNFGGPSEIIENGRTGFHVNPLDTDEISKTVEQILGNKEKLQWMTNTCKQEYERRFTLQSGVTRFLEALDRILGCKHNPPH